MIFNQRHYVPCLRWKMGEYQALFNLSDETKDMITPLIEVPEIGFDFETRKPAKSIDDHLSAFAKRIKLKWGKRSCFVDMNLIDPSILMENGMHPIRFIFDDLRAHGCHGIPIIGINRGMQYQNEIQHTISIDKNGLCLRIDIREAARPSLMTELDLLLKTFKVNIEECDLILDLHAPNFEPVSGFAKLITNIIKNLPYLDQWRTFTILGTSFPSSMGELNSGLSIIQRYEWLLYLIICEINTAASIRIPTFGDYGISHPNVLQLDMRIIKPSATIRYTIDDAWLILKGLNVRDNGYEQYHDLCKKITTSSHFNNVDFSEGDRFIIDCANGGSTGNLTVWRRVGTNHHLEKLVVDISSFFASSDIH